MADRDGYIPGVPCWVDSGQPDPEAAVDFYRGLFGWELEDTMPAGSPGRYFMARLRGGDVAAIGSLPEGAPAVAAWNTYIQVASADETAAKALAAGGSTVMEPFDVLDAGRMAMLADPEGAVFGAWQPDRMKGAQIVNEPGSVNFNGLHTRDVEAAKRFYGSVFGWGTITRRRRRAVDAARLRRSPRRARARAARAAGGVRRRRRASRTSSQASTRSATTSRTSPPTGA